MLYRDNDANGIGDSGGSGDNQVNNTGVNAGDNPGEPAMIDMATMAKLRGAFGK